jgi:hypothetical protein
MADETQRFYTQAVEREALSESIVDEMSHRYLNPIYFGFTLVKTDKMGLQEHRLMSC